MRLLEIIADEVVDLLLTGVRRAESQNVLAEGLIVGRVFAESVFSYEVSAQNDNYGEADHLGDGHQ
jgi:hypothetical protein